MAQEKLMVSVDALALRQILEALISAPHRIRELQAIRGLGENPIDTLVKQYNDYAAEKQADTTETPA